MPVSAQFRGAAQRARGRDVRLGIRPEHIGASHEVDWKLTQSLQGQVEMVELLGHEAILHFKVGEHVLTGRLASHGGLPAPGEQITMQLKCEAIHLFDPTNEQRLR
jgi:ABC-type sugar transport system ATPase subunit